MTIEYLSIQEPAYITGSERRHARLPRRSGQARRHRIRFESEISDCRSHQTRRLEEREGFVEFESLYEENNHSDPD
ncbi:MAG: hypothetical protein OEY87_00720 [Gammaproteobacteria bacterium]|nr:hypothetical protein [Gammaproteobacteria bacterium]MDH5734617.1 hypothetical protein [Gammaproteobacteria bacterium]